MPGAVEAALQSMCRGEAAAFTCARASAHGGAGSLLPAPPPSADTVELELALISMMQARPLPRPPPPRGAQQPGDGTPACALLQVHPGAVGQIGRDSEGEHRMRPPGPIT